MQLQTLNPMPIIEALRKLGYTIGWPSLEIEAYGPIEPGDIQHAPPRGVTSAPTYYASGAGPDSPGWARSRLTTRS